MYAGLQKSYEFGVPDAIIKDLHYSTIESPTTTPATPTPTTSTTTTTPTTPTTTTTPSSDDICDEGYKSHGSHCYKFVDEKISWTQAEAKCSSEGGNLASVPDEATNNFLVSIAPKRAFIGGYKKSDNTWAWSDGSPWSFSKWYKGEPNNHGGSEEVVELITDYGAWFDVPRNHSFDRGFICQKNPSTIIPGNNILLDSIPNWGKQFRVSFDFKVNSVTNMSQYGYSSLLHFTNDATKECCGIGQRIPAFYMTSSKNIHIATNIGNNGNYYKNIQLQLGQWYKIEVRQSLEAGKV